MVSPVGEKKVRSLPIEEADRGKALREILKMAIGEIRTKVDPLIDSYKDLQERKLPEEFDPLDIVYGLRHFNSPGFTPTRHGTTLGRRGRLFAADDLRIFNDMMRQYRGRIRTVGDLVNLISAGANGVLRRTAKQATSITKPY